MFHYACAFVSGGPPPYEQQNLSSEILQGPGSGLPPPGAGLHSSIFPPHSSPSSSAAAAASFNAAMAAAAAAGQQFALITSQGIPFIQPGIPAIYSSPAGKYIYSLHFILEKGPMKYTEQAQKLYSDSKDFHEISYLTPKFDISPYWTLWNTTLFETPISNCVCVCICIYKICYNL